VGEFVATGCGQSKKKAKHSAAKSILDKMTAAQNSGKAPATQPTIPDLAAEILSPYDDGIQGNPVGLLQELCMSRRWPPPTYDLSHEEGLPPERSVTIKCIIEHHHIEVGAGKSKKLAKRQAANKMIQRLRDQPVADEDAFQHIDDDMLAQGLAHVKEASLKSSSSHSQQVSRFHRNLKGSEGEVLERLHGLDLAATDLATEHVTLLQEMADEQKFEVTYVDIEEVAKSGRYQCLVQLSTLPVAVCFGDGEDSVAAQQAAAQNALDYLQIMVK
jgi:RISC-loading complex subunit TARBP2